MTYKKTIIGSGFPTLIEDGTKGTYSPGELYDQLKEISNQSNQAKDVTKKM
ncbi:hypothetical protein HNQ02_002933 [Flavobacterium sp. 7E]|uniref:hypothetical protein n=1 Tax=Flavobacterium sp. 7E TaxID=2735898 RepID=UPI0015710262|nr:hypothetical protein [Flavobacterium sp. 7E]NRS89998.1 hypothetical protein [Flavobacterium sp. 7E]